MNTDNHDIRKLLDRYYDGLATPEEVEDLRSRLYSASCLTPDLVEEKRMFEAIDNGCAEVPADLGQKLAEAIDAAERAENSMPRRKGFILRVFGIVTAAAACIAGLFFATDNSDSMSVPEPVLISQNMPADTDTLVKLAVDDATPANSDAEYGNTASVAVKETVKAQVAVAEKKTERIRTVKKHRGARIIADNEEALAYFQAAFDGIASDMAQTNRVLESIAADNNRNNNLLKDVVAR